MKKTRSRIVAFSICFATVFLLQTCMPMYVAADTTTAQQSGQNTGNTNTDTPEDETLQDTKKNAIQEIKEYGKVIKLKVSDEIAAQIDKVVKKYTDAIGTADGDKNTTGLSSEAGISDCVTEAKAAIDALVPNDSGDTAADNTTPSSTSEFVMVGGNWVTPVATYGQIVNIVLPVVNMGAVNLNNVTVTPVISNSVSEWPFEIETSGYTQTISDLPAKGNGQSDMDRRRELTWTLKTRADALSGYYKLQFNVLYYVGTEAENATLTTYVLVNGAPGSGNVEAEGGGTSTPRVIVTGFDTEPAKVNAGDTFVLTLHLKNTSKRTAVSNMLVNISAPSEGSDADSTYAAFLPTSGSNSEYIASIGKGATIDLSIEMTAKADLTQKPYQIDVNMEYEDEDYTAYTSNADVSIPVYQQARLELSTPEILPDSIVVGNESDIMFSIYNVGKTTLYNVKVSFVGDSITGGESFLGKIEAGSTGSVDSMVTGVAATTDDGTIKAVVTYEDEAGNQSTFEQEMKLIVTEDSMPDDGMYPEMEEMEYDETTGSSKATVIVVLVLIAVLVVITLVVLFIRKKKKKKEEEERINLLDEIEGKDDSDEIS